MPDPIDRVTALVDSPVATPRPLAEVRRHALRLRTTRHRRILGAIAIATTTLTLAVVLGYRATQEQSQEVRTATDPAPDSPPMSFSASTADGATLVVSQTRGLTDGQLLLVTGRRFKPRERLLLRICAHACDFAFRLETTVGEDGRFREHLEVRRRLLTADGWLDCATEKAGCRLSARYLGSFEPSIAVHFDRGGRLLPEPTLVIDPPGPYRNAQGVAVRGTGFPRQRTIRITQCRSFPGGLLPDECGRPASGQLEVRSDGSFRLVGFPLARIVGKIDCAEAPGRCEVVWRPDEGPPFARAPLTFAKDR